MNNQFYPTPPSLIRRMIEKIKKYPVNILEPSAGKGDIAKAIYKDTGRNNIHTIEINPEFRAILRDSGYRVIDTDFLLFSGPDKYDLIIANPPFESGDLHLLKAIDIMYRGEIIFLLNAETIKNPYTNMRKELVKKLDELKADIEYISNAFIDADRPSGVEIALVYINIERKVEDDLFAGANDLTPEIDARLSDNCASHEVSTRKPIADLVAEYNQIIRIGTETILSYYRNYRKIGRYIGLNQECKEYSYNPSCDMTSAMQNTLNNLLIDVRKKFWRSTLDLKDVRDRMTTAKQHQFEEQLKKHCYMDFTESNIRQFIINLINSYEDTITQAVLDIFKLFTVNHCYTSGLYDDNIHYFNGWKTNQAFKINKKVIIPIYGGYGKGPFIDEYSGKWRLDYGCGGIMRDIDIVMNYFNGLSNYVSIAEAIEHAFRYGQSRNIHSTFFDITVYKKGTMHLTFSDEDTLRRFNITACRGKEWLPHDYGKKAYHDLPNEEQAVVDSFEGAASYNMNLGRPLFANNHLLQISM